MTISELMQAMSDAGAPFEAILIAVKAIEDRDAAIEQRRATDRERKRRQREAQAGTDMDSMGQSTECHVTVTGMSQGHTPFPAPPNENNLTPPTHTPEYKSRARKGTRLPSDWQPLPLSPDCQAMVDRWQPGAIERELSKFRDWWAAKAGANGVKLDWQATWRNWLRSADERQGQRHNGNTNRDSTSETGLGRTFDAGLAVVEQFRALEAAQAGSIG